MPPPSLTSSSTRFRVGFFVLLLAVSLSLTYHFTPSFASHRSISPNEQTGSSEYIIDVDAEELRGQNGKRIAIVGAGASGSSAAFFLRRAANVVERRAGLGESSLISDIIVYEKEGYVGGRTTTIYPQDDDRARPQELGGSIFVDSNLNLMKAVKEFNLTLMDPDFGESGVGIWDGRKFLFTSSSSSWVTSARALLRYGPLSPFRTRRAVSSLLKKFLRLYDPLWLHDRGVVDSVEDFAEAVGLGREYTTRSGESWAREVVGAGERWVGEVWEGSTRVNYAMNIDKIHALAAGVSMATGGARQVEGGNYQIFQSMLADAGAKLYLGTTVEDIVPQEKGGLKKFVIKTNHTELPSEEVDHVFWAAPWGLQGMKSLEKEFIEPVPPTPYVRLHVTYLTTTQKHPAPSFFGLPSGSTIPNTILTSAHPPRSPDASSLPPPRFQSITWHGESFPGSNEYVVKIFSLTRLSDRLLREILGEKPTWVTRKEWNSYPKMEPTAGYAPVTLTEGVEYLAGMERWVSTMETQTISAREAVARVVQKWWGLGLGECEDGDSWDWTCS
ncbi:prenylcysteine oxidase/farnesylcysteine lyase [Cryptococcus neoformans Tu401-1]|nr:prenylcysteine oxidase/farnesylcysteine lyase [Cryptococcus neoformans var. grubii Bt85]OXC71233.1 hypothetical protein AYX13_00100 [Cryptococcus neoformans var. grubii]OXG20452.1 prenylcysteine oxidase/farnesylcysteine lyase [Cryptococcus neoformans var. grubii Tu401-1]OXM80319.1 prenylcysteine oxidase/farnesylcysteine lyase [Cryptococcus neoformans var. grubii Bt63]